MKNPNSVWTWPYRTRYYLLRPWRWFRHLFLNIRSSWMRAHKGYCYGDIWDFNSWFCSVAPEMLRYMAEYGCSFPTPFGEREKWSEWLFDMADRLEYCGKDFYEISDENNEYATELKEIIDVASKRWREQHPDEKNTQGQDLAPEEKEIQKKYWEREEALAQERQAYIQETFAELGKHWDDIWD